MDPDNLLNTTKSVADATGKIADAVKVPDEVKKAGLLPLLDRMAKTFQNKRNLRNVELDNENIILQEYQRKLLERTQSFLEEIPNATFNEANEYLLRKQIDDSQFSINNEYMRDRFAKLIATTATTKTDYISPNYSNVLSNLDSNTATLLVNLSRSHLNPLSYFGNPRTAIFSFLLPHPFKANSLIMSKGLKSNGAIDELASLGLILIRDNFMISTPDYPTKNLYTNIDSFAFDLGFTTEDRSSHAAIELTSFGRKFIEVVY